jgi:glyoxylase-like metal-dependent hydrolase (beta-lactamase superfamily II)
VLRTGGRTILIDSYVGEDAVAIVRCTYLHIDHVGWNTRLQNGRWVPTFPNARYLVGRCDFEYWRQQESIHSDALQLPGIEDSILPIVEAGRIDLVDDGYELATGLTLLPLSGHTPGQTGVRATGAVPAVFCGDAIHSPLQVLNPALSTFSCVDSAQVREVRRKLLEDAAEGAWRVVPVHVRGTRSMRVASTAQGFAPLFFAPGS